MDESERIERQLKVLFKAYADIITGENTYCTKRDIRNLIARLEEYEEYEKCSDLLFIIEGFED